ncbi:MAG: hypothetical protein HC831_10650 [Chloroflexia bacterium]|nr:hypothetical protein [Chloroflexia bacterium]
MKKNIFTLFISIFLTATELLAQTSGLIKRADREYNNLSYANAIELYEQILKKDPNNTEAKKKLANSYRNIRDSKNAERVYAQLAQSGTAEPITNLYYAQALAANSKYTEAQTYYQKYEQTAGNDSRGKGFADAYKQLDTFYSDSASYKVFYTSINSAQSDFSPMYDGKGLTFVSGRKQGTGVKRSFAWNNTAFLDLYHVSDTSIIKNVYQVQKTGDGTETNSKKYKNTGNDDDTRFTSNDSPTLGSFGKTFTKDEQYLENNNTPVRKMNGNVNSKYHEGPVSFFMMAKILWCFLQEIIITKANTKKAKRASINSNFFRERRKMELSPTSKIFLTTTTIIRLDTRL